MSSSLSPLSFNDNAKHLQHQPLLWRHNGCDWVSNHQPRDCLLNRLFRCRSKKTSKLCDTGLCEENSPVTYEFLAQRASNVENVSIWWYVIMIACWQELMSKLFTFQFHYPWVVLKLIKLTSESWNMFYCVTQMGLQISSIISQVQLILMAK